MFESTVVESKKRGLKRTSFISLPVAIAAHALLALSWLSSDLWHVQFPYTPPSAFEAYRVLQAVALPPPPPPPPPPAAPRPVEALRVKLPENVAPSIIPDTVPELELPKPSQVISDIGVEGGVEGGIEGGQVGGIVGGIMGGVIAEAPPPMTIVVPRDARLPVRPLSMEYPMYPEKWRLRQVEDRVILRYTIGTDGRVSEVRILFPAVFPEFNDASVRAIKKWRFQPLEINGEKKELVHELTINFKIEKPMPRMPRQKRSSGGVETAH